MDEWEDDNDIQSKSQAERGEEIRDRMDRDDDGGD